MDDLMKFLSQMVNHKVVFRKLARRGMTVPSVLILSNRKDDTIAMFSVFGRYPPLSDLGIWIPKSGTEFTRLR